MFFFEKKNQKTFISCACGMCEASLPTCRIAGNKSLFASFSSEKEDSFFLFRS